MSFNNVSWHHLVTLALNYGWTPLGVLPPKKDNGFAWFPDYYRKLKYRGASQANSRVAVGSLFPRNGDPILNSYFASDDFRVTAEDAKLMAGALEKALPDVPNGDALAHKSVELPGFEGSTFVSLDTPVNVFEWWSGENKDYLRKFIAFCREGEFEIHT